MAVVVVAGGLGDLGRPITDALFESGKYEVYIMSRKARKPFHRLSHDTDHINADCEQQLELGAHFTIDWQRLPPYNSDRLLV